MWEWEVSVCRVLALDQCHWQNRARILKSAGLGSNSLESVTTWFREVWMGRALRPSGENLSNGVKECLLEGTHDFRPSG